MSHSAASNKNWNKNELEVALKEPASALKKYYELYNEYHLIKSQLSSVEAELKDSNNSIKKYKKELSEVRHIIDSIEGKSSLDVDSEIERIKRKLEQKLKELRDKYDKDMLQYKKNNDSENDENEADMKQKLKKLESSSKNAQELSPVEKQALEFEIERQNFSEKSNERIKEYNQKITQEKQKCAEETIPWLKEIDEIKQSYEPKLSQLSKLMDSITEKYQPKVKESQKILSEEIQQRDREINELNQEKKSEVAAAEKEVDDYRADYKATKRDFDERIRLAKLQDRPYTQMENSRESALNGINKKIDSVNKKLAKKIASIEKQIDAIIKKYESVINKYEQALENVISERDNELSDPKGRYQELQSERDAKISKLQSKVDSRDTASSTIIGELKKKINDEKTSQKNVDEAVDKKIIAYIKSNNNGLDEIISELYTDFNVLRTKTEQWQKQAESIARNRLQKLYVDEYSKQRAELEQKSYEELLTYSQNAMQNGSRISFFSSHYFEIISVSLTTALCSLIYFICAIMIMEEPGVSLLSILIFLVSIGLTCYSVYKSKRDFSMLCRNISLAKDYTSFESIKKQSEKIMIQKELLYLTELGKKLYESYAGKKRILDEYEKTKSKIAAKYKELFRNLENNYLKNCAALESKSKEQIAKIRKEYDSFIKSQSSDLKELRAKEKTLAGQIKKCEQSIESCEYKIKANKDFFDLFNDFYKAFKEKIDDLEHFKNNIQTMGYCLDNSLYLLSGKEDQYGYSEIIKIDHKIESIVVLIDSGDEPSLKNKNFNKMKLNVLGDFLCSVVRMNADDIIQQTIVGDVSELSGFNSTILKSIFRISEFENTLQDARSTMEFLRKNQEKFDDIGEEINNLNAQLFERGEEPCKYTFLYIINSPDQTKIKLTTEATNWIASSIKYGLIPIFICDYNEWNEIDTKPVELYTSIKKLFNYSLVKYDGESYSIEKNTP